MNRSRHFWLCAALGPLAWAGGALIDERLHLGITHWLTLCRQSASPLAAMELQLALLPMANLAMLSALLLGTVRVAIGHSHAAPLILAGQVGCAATMLLMPTLCTALIGGWQSPVAAIGAMWLLETALSAGIAAAALVSLPPTAEQQQRSV